MIKEFLQGKWLGHPLHPALVHLPTGLLPVSLLFDILSRSGIGANAMVQTSFYCISMALLIALLAVPAGLADWLDIKTDKPAYKVALWHMSLNLLVAILFATNFALRLSTFQHQNQIDLLPLFLSILGTLVLIVSGYLGSWMVFDQGIGIARFSKKKWRKLALAGHSNVPPES